MRSFDALEAASANTRQAMLELAQTADPDFGTHGAGRADSAPDGEWMYGIGSTSVGRVTDVVVSARWHNNIEPGDLGKVRDVLADVGVAVDLSGGGAEADDAEAYRERFGNFLKTGGAMHVDCVYTTSNTETNVHRRVLATVFPPSSRRDEDWIELQLRDNPESKPGQHPSRNSLQQGRSARHIGQILQKLHTEIVRVAA